MCRERVRDGGRRGRSAFTLVEVVIVIAIIAALVALTAAAVLRFRTVQTTWNTKNLVQRLNSQFRKQWSTVADQARRENIPTSPVDYLALVNQLANNDADRARVIWVKLRLKQAFPVSFQEALNPYPLPPLAGYQQYLTNLGFTSTTAMVQYDPRTPLGVYDSSACLLMALQRGPSGMGVDVEDLAGSTNVRTIPTPSGGTIKILVDAWGTPLLFSRWPVGNCLTQYPSGSAWPYPIGHSDINAKTDATWTNYTYAPGDNDPTDPMGRLTNDGTWLTNDTNNYQAWLQGTNPNAASFQRYCHPILAPQAGYSLYLPPVIVSAGLQSPNKATNFGFDYTTNPVQQPVWNLALDPNNPNDHGTNIYSTDLP